MGNTVKIEKLYPGAWQDRAIMFFAQTLMERATVEISNKYRPYWVATMKLIRDNPEQFRLHGYSFDGIRFRNFKNKGKNKTLISCEAYWSDI